MAHDDSLDDYDELALIAHDAAMVKPRPSARGGGFACPVCDGLVVGDVEQHTPACVIGRSQAWRTRNVTSV